MADATSQWALTPYYRQFRWLEVSLAISGLTLGIAILRSPMHRRVSVFVLLAVFRVGRGLVGWVNEDAPGAAPTLRGDIHWTLGIVSFVSSTTAMLVAAGALRRAGAAGVARLSRFTGALSAAAVVLLLISAESTPLTPYVGVFERTYYLATIVWVATVCLASPGGVRDRTTDA